MTGEAPDELEMLFWLTYAGLRVRTLSIAVMKP